MGRSCRVRPGLAALLVCSTAPCWCRPPPIHATWNDAQSNQTQAAAPPMPRLDTSTHGRAVPRPTRPQCFGLPPVSRPQDIQGATKAAGGELTARHHAQHHSPAHHSHQHHSFPMYAQPVFCYISPETFLLFPLELEK